MGAWNLHADGLRVGDAEQREARLKDGPAPFAAAQQGPTYIPLSILLPFPISSSAPQLFYSFAKSPTRIAMHSLYLLYNIIIIPAFIIAKSVDKAQL